jgi:pimeloyl-[acyl-carrier protein] methyl ester esterase
MTKSKLFLVPGWAVNSNVWHAVAPSLASKFELHYHDFPGYGKRHCEDGNRTLQQLADDAIDHAPADAMWLGWSLGAIVAVQAALRSPRRISSLNLVCPTAKFASDSNWQHGQSAAAIDNLSQRFQTDYPSALKRFLLLQAGTDVDARAYAKRTLRQIKGHPAPDWATLESGLNVLRTVDLRIVASQLSVATQIIVGQHDRVIPPTAGIDLHHRIAGSKLQELPTGHAPFVEQPASFVDVIERINQGSN